MYRIIFNCLIFLGLCAVVFSKSRHNINLNHDLQIIGGKNTTVQKHPYQVSITFKDNFYCSGAVIDKFWVLTTASCVEQVQNMTQYMTVRGKSTFHASGGTIYNVSECVVHPNFTFWTMDYDVAIIKVNKAFSFGKKMKKISLANKSLRIKQKAVISGWGSTNGSKDTVNTQLKQITVEVIKLETCQKSYSLPTLSNRMFCAVSEDYGPCRYEDADLAVKRNKLYGLLSFNNGCDYAQTPSVYADVSVMRKWILNTIKHKNKEQSTLHLSHNNDDIVI